jgi:hypothetical protein
MEKRNKSRFTLEHGKWYACQFFGDFFKGFEAQCSYAPIKVEEVRPMGNRKYELHFYHANYPAGVKDKVYELQTIERGQSFILAKTTEKEDPRFLRITTISAEWISKHFGQRPEGNLEDWLERNA